MNKYGLLIVFIFISGIIYAQTSSLFIEAESFEDKGGWVVDPQFVEQMGSPYLLAHGMGKPVKDASTEISINNSESYHVWVRTKNWVPGNWEAPGRFLVSIDGEKLENELGINEGWNWEYAGSTELEKGIRKITLHDLTGFEGRCDAIYLTTEKDEKLPNELTELKKWRLEKIG